MARPEGREHSVQPIAGNRPIEAAKGNAKACFQLDIRIRNGFTSFSGLIASLRPVT